MRVFLFKFNSTMLMDAILELKRRGVEVIYWAGSKDGFEAARIDKKNFPETIFHNTYDAVLNIPTQELDCSNFEPLSKDMLRRLGECESQALAMMDSIDLDNRITQSKRRHIYYDYLRYWYGVLITLKPDAILFSDIPHLSFQFVVYCLAKMLGIRTIMYRVIQVTGRLLFLDDIERYGRLEKELGVGDHGVDCKLGDLSQDVQDYYRKQVDPHNDSSPFYMKKDFVEACSRSYGLPRLGSVVKNIKSLTFLKTTCSYIKMFFHKRKINSLEGFHYRGFFVKWKLYQWNKTKKSFRQEYLQLQGNADLSSKFIYVPLQNQPECSTSAMGGVFSDQILMVETLAASVPDDWAIYVKENPLQWRALRTQTGRYQGYYKKLARIRNVVLISTHISTYRLIEKSQAVATVTSTAGWEAVLRSRPVLVFGYIWYMYCGGVFRVTGIDSCREAIEKIREGYKPDRQKVLNFLAAVDRASIVGYPNIRFKERQNLDISEEENVRNIAGAFADALDLPALNRVQKRRRRV